MSLVWWGHPVISLAANGAPVKSRSQHPDQPQWRRDRRPPGILSVADLKGKTVAIWNGSWSQQMMFKALDEAGVPRDSVNYKFLLPAEASMALGEGRYRRLRYWEPYVSLQEKKAVP